MTDLIQIEGGIPVPSRNLCKEKYPLSRMKVGDSFFLSATKGAERRLRGAVSARAKRLQQKFTVRRVTENAVSGLRVWRTA